MKLVLLLVVLLTAGWIIHWIHEDIPSSHWCWSDSLPFSKTIEHSFAYNLAAIGAIAIFLWAVVFTVRRAIHIRTISSSQAQGGISNAMRGFVKVLLIIVIVLVLAYMGSNIRVRKFFDLDIIQDFSWPAKYEVVAFITLVTVLTATYLVLVILLWNPYFDANAGISPPQQANQPQIPCPPYDPRLRQ